MELYRCWAYRVARDIGVWAHELPVVDRSEVCLDPGWIRGKLESFPKDRTVPGSEYHLTVISTWADLRIGKTLHGKLYLVDAMHGISELLTDTDMVRIQNKRYTFDDIARMAQRKIDDTSYELGSELIQKVGDWNDLVSADPVTQSAWACFFIRVRWNLFYWDIALRGEIPRYLRRLGMLDQEEWDTTLRWMRHRGLSIG